MAEVVKKATRDAYGETLVELGAEYPDLVVLDSDLAGATKTGMFRKAYPDRFFNCGIAEQNMMGIAAGLAACGKKVFASTFAMFAAGRAFEQVRNSRGYPHLRSKSAPPTPAFRLARTAPPPVLRGYRADAHNPRHDSNQSSRRGRGGESGARRSQTRRAGVFEVWAAGGAGDF